MPNRQAGTTVMRLTALEARMKLPSNMAAPGIKPGSMQRLGAKDANDRATAPGPLLEDA